MAIRYNMITQNDISNARFNIDQLVTIKNQLILEKMKMDKFFSIFLDSTYLDDTLDSDKGEYETQDWKTYKSKAEEYENIQRLILLTDFYTTHYE